MRLLLLHPPEKSDLKTTLHVIKGLFHNKYWLMLTMAMLTLFSADVVFGTANTYYCRYFLDNPNHVGTFATIMNVFKIGSMIILLPIMLRRYGKRNALVVASAIIFVSLFARFIDPNDAMIAFVAAGFYGFGQGFTYACLFAMLPDCVEYGEYTDHERHEGLVYAGASFGMKLAAGLGAVLASITMQVGGYVNNAPEQTPEAMNAILLACTVVPAVLYVLCILSVVGYKLDKLYPDIIRELQKRKSEAAKNAGEAAAPADAQ